MDAPGQPLQVAGPPAESDGSSSAEPGPGGPRHDAAAAGSGSVIADKYASCEWRHAPGQIVPESYPSDAEVAAAVEATVSGSAATYRSYRHVAWLTAFVAAYLAVLYYQAAAFRAGEVVAALKSALLPGGSPSLAFASNAAVLGYLGATWVAPVFKDPVCGDGLCTPPWEGPAWGPFGCQADCGTQPNTTRVVVALSADFTGHPSISAAALRARVAWNLCLNDAAREAHGLPALCWFAEDQTFSEAVETQIRAVSLIDGDWVVRLRGDLAGRVTGGVYDASAGEDALAALALSQSLEPCQLKKRRTAAATSGGSTARRLLGEVLTLSRTQVAGEALLRESVEAAAAAAAQGAAGKQDSGM